MTSLTLATHPPISQAQPAPNLDKRLAEKISRQWKHFGWDELSTLQTTHPDFCEFIHRTKLVYAIRGYQSSLQSSEVEGVEKLREAIHLDEDGHPCLLKEGQWTRWETLKEQIDFNPETRELVSKEDQNQEWNYYYNPQTGEQGLNPQSRYNQVRPIYQLSKSEMERLGMDGANCILQVFTTSVFFISQLSHVGLRLIDKNGQVYSLGYETPSWEIKYNQQKIVGNYHVEISSLDYDEFTKFKNRRVTSIPMTPDQMKLALGRAEMYTQKKLRFNRIHQNCATYVTDIMRAAQLYTPPIACNLRDFFWDFIIDIPVVGTILDKIKKVVVAIFELLSAIPLVGYIFDGFMYVANKILTVTANLLILSFGGSKGSEPDPDAPEDTVDNSQRLTYFSRLIKSWKDLFKEDRDLIFSPKRMVDWQLKQPNTVIHPFEGPKFYIAPPTKDSEE